MKKLNAEAKSTLGEAIGILFCALTFSGALIVSIVTATKDCSQLPGKILGIGMIGVVALAFILGTIQVFIEFARQMKSGPPASTSPKS